MLLILIQHFVAFVMLLRNVLLQIFFVKYFGDCHCTLVTWFNCRQPILVLYACFGLSYFYYDVVVMFIGAYLEDKQEDPQRSLHYIWTKFYRKKKLIILHHVLLPIVGFPALTVSVLKFQPQSELFCFQKWWECKV